MIDELESSSGINVECWGCHKECDVPVWQGTALPILKCRWCGALIENINQETSVQENPARNASRKSNGYPKRINRPLKQRLLGIATASIVILIVTTVAVGAIFVVLPTVTIHYSRQPIFLHTIQFLALILYTFILINYISIIMTHPGPVDEKIVENVRKGNCTAQQLYDWRWCVLCDAPKPPTAHHCRRCGLCVDGLDHHCLFTANGCIGKGNEKVFVSFLWLVLTGCVIAAPLSIIMGWRFRRDIIDHTMAIWHVPPRGLMKIPGLRSATFAWRWVLAAPLPQALWSLTLIFSLSSGLGVALLLKRHVSIRSRGSTVFDEIRRRREALIQVKEGHNFTSIPGTTMYQSSDGNRQHGTDIFMKDKEM